MKSVTKTGLATLAFTAVAFAAMTTAASAATIVNGDFETLPASGVPTGWTVTPGTEIGVIVASAYGPCCGVSGTPAQLANKFVSFGAGNLANISKLSQIFTTVAGQSYTVKFDFGVLGNGAQTLFADILNGSSSLTSGSWTQSANNNLGTTFSTSGLTFIAGGASTQISFNVNAATNNVDGILDNVSVSAVPEPATWLMMILGFGFVGGAMRSRQRQTAKVSFG